MSGTKGLSEVELEDVLVELGMRRKKKQIVSVVEQETPQNKYWLHDTPGAINDMQVLIDRRKKFGLGANLARKLASC